MSDTVNFPIIDPTTPEGDAYLRRMVKEQDAMKQKNEQRKAYTAIKNRVEDLENDLDCLAGCLESVVADSEYPEAVNFFRVFQVYAEKLSADVRGINDDIYKAWYLTTLD